MRLFMRRRGDDGPARDASRALAELVRATLALPEEATVSVSEISCGDPACGGAETVVLVMRPGRRTEAAKVLMPMAQVTREALLAALAPLEPAPLEPAPPGPAPRDAGGSAAPARLPPGGERG